MSSPVDRLHTNQFATLADRISQLQASGQDVIRLDVGSPDMPPAAHILTALQRSAALPDSHGYQPHQGPGALRAAWSGLYRRMYGVHLEPDRQVLPLLGSKEGIFHLSLALLSPGDVVLIPDPGYPTYLQGALFAMAEPFMLSLRPENGYLPDLDSIPPEIASRARLLWLNYPNNPTAAVATQEFFAQAVAFCSRHQILLCHDAAYSQITFDGYQAPSVLSVPGAAEIAVELNTLSKSHNMAGWRLGVALGQTKALVGLLKLKTHADSGHFLPVMQAAITALTGDQSWLQVRNAIYQARRDRLVAGLSDLGLEVIVPQASLYVWLPLPAGWGTEQDFVYELLEQVQVCLAPGTLFGPGGRGFVRLALTEPLPRLELALERIRAFIER